MTYEIIDNRQIITVNNIQKTSKATLAFYDKSKKIFETDAFIGKNGITQNKVDIQIMINR